MFDNSRAQQYRTSRQKRILIPQRRSLVAPAAKRRRLDCRSAQCRRIRLFEEVRVTAKGEFDTDRLCRAVWGDGNMKTQEPGFKLRRDEGEQRRALDL